MKLNNDQIREKVIGAAMAVHRTLGPGFLEAVYEKALAIELQHAGIEFESQRPMDVHYRGLSVGHFIADFVIEGDLILEIKAVSALTTAHEVQLVNYLTATGTDNGLLINFGGPSLEVRRKFRTPKNPVNPVNPVERNPVSLQAFTMLELLVAMAIMAVLLVLLLNMVDAATKLWRENENRVDSYREARAALGIISRDLQNTVAAATNTHFLANSTAFPQLPGTALQDTNTAGALFFLTALPAKAQNASANRSDVCQVGYFLALDRANVSSPTRTLNLYRYFRSSDPTFTNLSTGSGLFTNVVIGSADTELLARNIVGFTVRPLTLTNNTFVTFTASSNTPTPDAVEVTISAINQDAAKRLDNNATNWTDTNSPIIRPVLQTFTTRVKID